MIAGLPNLGPKTAKRLAEIGIASRADLAAAGAAAAYARLRFRFGREVTLNALYAMDAALAGIDWRAVTDLRKRELRRLAEVEK
jgi:DNA transformation protein and related proteins